MGNLCLNNIEWIKKNKIDDFRSMLITLNQNKIDREREFNSKKNNEISLNNAMIPLIKKRDELLEIITYFKKNSKIYPDKEDKNNNINYNSNYNTNFKNNSNYSTNNNFKSGKRFYSNYKYLRKFL